MDGQPITVGATILAPFAKGGAGSGAHMRRATVVEIGGAGSSWIRLLDAAPQTQGARRRQGDSPSLSQEVSGDRGSAERRLIGELPFMTRHQRFARHPGRACVTRRHLRGAVLAPDDQYRHAVGFLVEGSGGITAGQVAVMAEDAGDDRAAHPAAPVQLRRRVRRAAHWKRSQRCHGLGSDTAGRLIGLPPSPRVRGATPLTYTWHFDLPHADAAHGADVKKLDTARTLVERAYHAHHITAFAAGLEGFIGLGQRAMHDRMLAAGLDPDDDALIAAMVAAGWEYHQPFEHDGEGDDTEGTYWRAAAHAQHEGILKP